jgi:hypothetical protein
MPKIAESEDEWAIERTDWTTGQDDECTCLVTKGLVKLLGSIRDLISLVGRCDECR